MKLFVAYLFVSVLIGLFLRKKRRFSKIIVLVGVCLLVSLAFYFLNQI